MASQVYQSYHKDCEGVVHKQINLVLSFSYVYLSMVIVVFSGFISDLKLWSPCIVGVGSLYIIQFIDVSCLLPSTPTLPLQKPDHGNGLEAMQGALQMENDVNRSLLDLHKLSSDHTDPHCKCRVHKKVNENISHVSDYTYLAVHYLIIKSVRLFALCIESMRALAIFVQFLNPEPGEFLNDLSILGILQYHTNVIVKLEK
ncbi:ferritin, middle subunit-like [Stegostoma tigrinum]|uniref:ferritin, middle subunit-like n=1 Tax=Stegostoma tigrinum TaxID=3053191 RepID=UPI00286FF4E5|nr:ferritin, middle subunit-like [Stegostoma tigrinum]